mgnify:CR=1 FL=1
MDDTSQNRQEARPSSALAPPEIGTISERLLTIIRELAAGVPEQATRVFEVIRRVVPEYGAIGDPALRNEIRDSNVANTRLWYEVLLSGMPPGPAQIKPIQASARRRVHQGISFAALMHAYRAGFLEVWNILLERAGQDSRVRDELLFKVSPYLLYHVDYVGQVISEAYTQELQQTSRWRDRVRHELCGILFSAPEDEQGFREKAAALGLDPAAAHTALALQMSGLKAEMAEHQVELEDALRQASEILNVDPQSILRTLRPGHLLIWLPVPLGEVASRHALGLARDAWKVVSAAPGIDAVGIGLPDTGAQGWRRSADQALRAIELGSRLDPTRQVFGYAEYALEHAVMESPTLNALLQSLLEGVGGEPMLMETLQAYCDHGPHRKAIAGALDIHPNTLVYRLERIEAALGDRLSNLRLLTRLYLALRLRQMSIPAHSPACRDTGE